MARETLEDRLATVENELAQIKRQTATGRRNAAADHCRLEENIRQFC